MRLEISAAILLLVNTVQGEAVNDNSTNSTTHVSGTYPNKNCKLLTDWRLELEKPKYFLLERKQCFFQPTITFTTEGKMWREYNSKRDFFTWKQAEAICAAYGAHLPVLVSNNSIKEFKKATSFRRVYLGLLRNDSIPRGWFFRLPQMIINGSLVDMAQYDDTVDHEYDFPAERGFPWAKMEPNNANGNENCSFSFHDGTWGDYPCDHIPAFEWCRTEVPDMILKVDPITILCHRLHDEECLYRLAEPRMVVIHDWWIIISLAFLGVIVLNSFFLVLRWINRKCNKGCKSKDSVEKYRP